ncbi:MAG: aminotransferase class IV [Phormidesmis sp.]
MVEQSLSPDQEPDKALSWHDGQLFNAKLQPSHPPHDDLALKFGATVFTTLRVHNQNLDHELTQWLAHCDRLAYSIQTFGWTIPDWENIREGCEQLKKNYPILRITVFPDGREWITGRSLPKNLLQKTEKGITGWLAPPTYARSLPTHKTGNYLACWLARNEAYRQGADEAILTNAQGDWLETSTGNLWGWGNGQWWTPLDHRCLSGIMGNTLRKILVKAGQPVNLQSWHAMQPQHFEAIAYSNCVVGILPIHTIIHGNTKLEYDSQHERIKSLQSQVSQLTHRHSHDRSVS